MMHIPCGGRDTSYGGGRRREQRAERDGEHTTSAMGTMDKVSVPASALPRVVRTRWIRHESRRSASGAVVAV